MERSFDPQPRNKPNELPSDAKLEPGYIRYIRFLDEDCPNGEFCFETCIRRAPSDDDVDWELPISEILHSLNEDFYSAISYAWGDPEPVCPIIVDGHVRLVAENLWCFLQRTNVRRQGQNQQPSHDEVEMIERIIAGIHAADEYISSLRKSWRDYWPEHWLWIDALCIDQADDEERTHQVGIMSTIFGQADQVICWLGPAYDNSEHAMTTISGYSNFYSDNFSALDPTELSEATCSLCQRPYWKRLWVFQELKHAKDIRLMCGNEMITWDSFKNLWRVIVHIDTTDEDQSERLRRSLATRMMTLRTKPMNLSLWNLLKETEELDCALRGDRVYALLSVATEGHEDIEAHYQISHLTLAVQILRNKYFWRPPKSPDSVDQDCQYLESIFGESSGYDIILRELLNDRKYLRRAEVNQGRREKQQEEVGQEERLYKELEQRLLSRRERRENKWVFAPNEQGD